MIETLLKDFKHENEPVHEWAFLEISNCRIYHELLNGEGMGFIFYVLEEVGTVNGKDFDPETTTIQCLFNGTALFDGMRHLYMGDKQTDNFGYLYYPDLHKLSEIFIVLKMLEQRHCNQAE